MNEKGELYVKNFIIYEINMDYYDKIWYSKNEDEIKKNQYMIMLDLDKKELKSMPKDKIVDKYITNVTIVNDDPEFQKYMSDEEDKKKIQEAINNMKGEYTILIIAHRFSTILNSDKIMVLDNGKITAEGTHEELLNKSKEYKKLYESELKKDK